MDKTLFTLLSLLTAALVTYAIRWVPFLFFRKHEKLPSEVIFLGKFLPTTIMVSLVVFCLRHTDFLGTSKGIPEILSLLLTVLIHGKFRNIFVSVISGTALYMILVNLVFI